MKIRYIVLLLLLLSACNQGQNKQTDANKQAPENKPFKAFLAKFKPIALPFNFQLDHDSVLTSKSNLLEKNSTDTLFIKWQDDKVYCYGMLPDTSNYYAVIALQPAESFYPELYTFTKDGKKISEERLLVDGCGAGPDLPYCSARSSIDKNLGIYCSDTITIQDIDQAGNPIKGSQKSTVEFRKGSIEKDGKINLPKAQTVKIEKNIR